jgi:hypothetical protein
MAYDTKPTGVCQQQLELYFVVCDGQGRASQADISSLSLMLSCYCLFA